jgi:MinD superfamily P-loop ATPase
LACLKLAVASGKGGTGKTTVAVNMARASAAAVQLLDCDVEEPNDHLFLKVAASASAQNGAVCMQETVTVPVPRVDESKCDGCGECSRFCRYHAIVSFGTVPLTFPELCHSCGGCGKVCPRQAISEVQQPIGIIETMAAGPITLIQGRLNVGVAMAPPLIRAVKTRMVNQGLAILDAPAGTSCPVIATVRDADLVVLVTEPTPFGLHDLRLAVQTVRELGVPFGVVVNRVGVGDDRVHSFCDEEGAPILMEIPDDRRIAEAYSRGRLIVDALPEYLGLFRSLLQRATRLAAGPRAVTVDARSDRGSAAGLYRRISSQLPVCGLEGAKPCRT